MPAIAASRPMLIDALWPAAKTERWARWLVLMVGGALLLTISAKAQVPFWPVPMTMQTFVVLVLGATYGWRLGGATVLFYLVEGACGLPVFAGTPERGIGLAYMAGPTGGYLLGFLLAAVAVGWLAERGWDRRLGTTLAMMILGHLVIFALGVPWLARIVGWDTAFQQGVVMFWLATLLKTGLAAALMPMVWRFVSPRR